jgi:hypothetical protein
MFALFFHAIESPRIINDFCYCMRNNFGSISISEIDELLHVVLSSL